jgi:exocyst complex component 6
MNLPWSQTFYLCCQDVSETTTSTHDLTPVIQIRNFVNKYYQFVEGVAQYQRDIDELLGKVCQKFA